MSDAYQQNKVGKYICSPKCRFLLFPIIFILILCTNSTLAMANKLSDNAYQQEQIIIPDPVSIDVSKFIPKNAEIIQKKYAAIIDKNHKDIFVHSQVKQTETAKDYYTLISFDQNTKKFKRLFETSIQQAGGFQETKIAKLSSLDLSVIIISWGHRNTGGIANNIVLGAPNGKVKKLLQTTSQELYFKNGKIIEPNWDQAKCYTWKCNKLKGTPFLPDLERKKYDDHSMIIQYCLTANDEIMLKPNSPKINMKTGQKLYLVRTNFGTPCKILYPGDALEFEKDSFGYYEIATTTGDYIINIITMGKNEHYKEIKLSIAA